MRTRARAWRIPAALCLAACALACTEEPSYQLSWRLASEPAGLEDVASNPALTAVSQCSEVGLAQLEVTTRDGDGTIVDISRYPCFPPVFADGQPTDGPTELAPGEYTLQIDGLRRTEEPWVCGEDDPGPCVARANATVTVVEGQLPEVEFVLLAPPQCDDGVDNDGDGRVDGHDPACLLDPTASEDFDAGAVIFQLTATFLDNQVVAAPDVRVTSLVATVDGEPFFSLNTAELDPAFWPYRLPVFSERYEPGVHTLGLVGLGQDGEPRTQALTHEFTVNEEQAGFVLHQFDFSSDAFLEPIVEPFSVLANLLTHPGAGLDESLFCELRSGEDVGDVRIRVRDEGDQVVDLLTVGLSVEAVDDGDGWVRLPCAPAPIRSGDLTWGAYTLEAEVLAAGTDTVCFADAYDVTVGPLDPAGPAPLAPKGSGSDQNLYLERVADIVDGSWEVPADCVECATNSDCVTSSSLTCVDGLCVHE